QNDNAYYDMPTLKALSDSGVQARAIPSPSSADVPYEHAKMIIADGNHGYIGSVNLSTASTTNAREVGILFDDPTSIKMISDAFEHDWATGLDVTTALSVKCP
ncbi:MAG: phospholipase D-like domain-containing protein, partial [Polyangiaceae bacterium]